MKIVDVGLCLDSRSPRPLCFVSHAHSDHTAVHGRTICTPATAALMGHRLGASIPDPLDFDVPFDLSPDSRIILSPAGHVLGSAMLHLTCPAGSFLYTGDFKLRPSLTVEQARPREADYLLTECTYGQPVFRFPPWETVADQLVNLAGEAMRAGRQPIVMGYSLGKAQEIVRILTRAGLPVTAHGAVHSICRIYEQFGVDLGLYRRYAPADFHGTAALDLSERGVLVAPPNVARAPFATRFDNPCRIVMTGWALLKNATYRYGVEHALPLSDHADFDELLELVDIVRPKKVYTHHGYRQFADLLKSRGIDAEPAQPDAQMSLFGE